jgi:hypothetical protein
MTAPNRSRAQTRLQTGRQIRLWRTPLNDETPVVTGVSEYRYRDSNPGYRRERAAS